MSLRKQGYTLACIREVTGVPAVTAMRMLKAAGFPGKVPPSYFGQGGIKGFAKQRDAAADVLGRVFARSTRTSTGLGFLNRKGEAVLPKCPDCGRKFQCQRGAARCVVCAEARDRELQRLRMLRYYRRLRQRSMKAVNGGNF